MKLSANERLFRSRLRSREYHRQRSRRQPCEICGVEPAECHHIDYNNPERIMWLCTKHHKQTHSQFGKPAPLDWHSDIRAAQKRICEARRALPRHSSDQMGVEVDGF